MCGLSQWEQQRGGVGGLRAVDANADFGAAVLRGVTEDLAGKAAPRSRDKEPYHKPHVASFN